MVLFIRKSAVEGKVPQKPNAVINPLVPERQDEQFSLQIQRLEVDLKLNCGFIFFAPQELMG